MSAEALGGAMLGSVFSKTLRDHRRALVGWSIGLVGVALMYSAFYPSIVDNARALSTYLKTFPEPLQRAFFGSDVDFISPGGYLQTELFGFFGPILMLVFAIGTGARAIAGEEEDRSLDLLLSTPLARSRVVRDKALALIAGAAILAAVVWAALLVIGPPFDLDPGFANIGAACSMLFLLAVTFGMVALAAGCATGQRGRAVAIAAGLAAAMWILDVLAPSVEAIAWLQKLSAFYYYDENTPVKHGLVPLNIAVLAGASAVAYVVAVTTFERRDLAS
jgi:ABC-2 type transport system permease protein